MCSFHLTLTKPIMHVLILAIGWHRRRRQNKLFKMCLQNVCKMCVKKMNTYFFLF